MKIITNDAAYLQKYYLNILVNSTLVTGIGVPISMFDITNKKLFNKYKSKDFIKFTKKEEIEFLKEADWIIDYSLYINKSINEIKREIEAVDLEGKEIDEYFLSLSKEQRELEHGYLLIKVNMLRHKRESLVDILKLKENNKTITFKENTSLGEKIKKLFIKK